MPGFGVKAEFGQEHPQGSARSLHFDSDMAQEVFSCGTRFLPGMMLFLILFAIINFSSRLLQYLCSSDCIYKAQLLPTEAQTKALQICSGPSCVTSLNEMNALLVCCRRQLLSPESTRAEKMQPE